MLGAGAYDYAFHSKEEVNPSVVFDLGKEKEVHGLIIYNRKLCCKERAAKLTVWISADGKNWSKYWTADTVLDEWNIPFQSSSMGAAVSGKKCVLFKLGLILIYQKYYT